MKNITIDYNLKDLNVFTPVLRGWSSHLLMVLSITTALISLVIQITVYRSLKRLGPRHINQMIIPNQVIVFKTVISWVRLQRPVIQANGRLIFEDDLRSGGLLDFTTQ